MDLDVSVAEPAVHAYLVIPYRITFDVGGVLQALQHGRSLLWHYWSDLTDFQRVSISRRQKIMWYRFQHLWTSMPMPWHTTAVR